ncbi:MAG: hypothetical protein JXR80_12210 [Deltaproteobacteria bacterium]|nr:hypothetical protein [Deltaproteobacteria bacterium]
MKSKTLLKMVFLLGLTIAMTGMVIMPAVAENASSSDYEMPNDTLYGNGSADDCEDDSQVSDGSIIEGSVIGERATETRGAIGDGDEVAVDKLNRSVPISHHKVFQGSKKRVREISEFHENLVYILDKNNELEQQRQKI